MKMIQNVNSEMVDMKARYINQILIDKKLEHIFKCIDIKDNICYGYDKCNNDEFVGIPIDNVSIIKHSFLANVLYNRKLQVELAMEFAETHFSQANLLGISERNLYREMKTYGLNNVIENEVEVEK
jgi:hypothetical protein